jgi:alanine racemase
VALRALARINLAAITRNVALLRERAGPAVLCAVVKAQASGHGAVPVAQAALDGGAVMLAVATVGEAVGLRDAGITAAVLIMGAISDEEMPDALASRAELVAWDVGFVDRLEAGVAATRRDVPVAVHVKLDSGMGRMGTRDPQIALMVAERIVAAQPLLELVGVMTHLATADDDCAFVAEQMEAFTPLVDELQHRHGRLLAHAANSAATLREPATHLDMVRCGIAMYGCDPMNEDPDRHGLEPALELVSYVATVKSIAPGQSAGYGRRWIADRDTCLATVPIGYADGVRRGLTNNCDVLIDGRRYALVGTVSMDNITVDLGPDTPVRPGAEVVLIGRSGAQRQSVEDLANRLQTINHEVLCGLSARVHRRYHRDGAPPP